MKRRTIFLMIAMLMVVFTSSNTAFATKKNLKLDKNNSTVEWLGKKVTGEHSGTISVSEGSLVMNNGEIVSGNFAVDMTSIVNTDIKDEAYRAKLEGHLKSDDFFGVEKHPQARFEITDSEKLTDGNYKVMGKITIKGIVQNIEFKVNMHMHDDATHVSGKLVIDRTKFNVRYGSGSFFDNLGDKTIYDDFELKLNLYLN